MNIPNWFYDERVQQIAPEKLNLLLHLAAQLEGKTSQIEIMKEGKSVEEQQKMDETLQKARQMFSGKR